MGEAKGPEPATEPQTRDVTDEELKSIVGGTGGMTRRSTTSGTNCHVDDSQRRCDRGWWGVVSSAGQPRGISRAAGWPAR